MEDRDSTALRLASGAVTQIDIRYRLADAIGKDELADARDRAWTAYALARHRLLADGIIVTEADLSQLDGLSDELSRAAEIADVARGAIRLAGLLGRIALA